jgi:N-methylhydantoinase B
MNAIELELMWSRLRSIASERAKAMQRTAFSSGVREAGDLAYGLFDARARMIVQAETGTPGHINPMASCGVYLAEMFKDNLQEGDVLIINDPWRGSGHNFDITVFGPIFREGRIIGYVGSNNHHTDIGGIGTGIGANDVHEEGIWIPALKLFEAGKPNKTLFEMLRANSRTPNLLEGDLMNQVAAGFSGAQALNDMCDRYNLDDVEELADAIVTRSEAAMRESIRRLPAGTWLGESQFDIPNGDIITLRVAATIDNQKGEVLLDFAGSSPQHPKGVNVTLNYTHGYATFAVRSILNPTVPNNVGSMAPIKVTAPKGSILNCVYPAPVAGRHLVAMFAVMPIMKAFYNVVPKQVVAPSTGAGYSCRVFGSFANGERFVTGISGLTGGMGARATKPGLDATYYPAGLGTIPTEILESESLIVFKRRQLLPGTGGVGRFKGGDGQVVEFFVNSNDPWMLKASPTSRNMPPEGIGGGSSGKAGSFRINGEEVIVHGKMPIKPGSVVYMETPGGGGYGLSTSPISGKENNH